MKVKIWIAVLIYLWISQYATAQTCTGCRYLTPLFDSVAVTTVMFGEGENIDGQLQQLYMDIYEPVGDTVSNRPVIIFAFGGGFVTGSRDDWYVVEVCKHFARSGYVAVAIDYRYGIDPLEILLLQYMRIFFRPMQDMRAAIEYLKADYALLGNNFRIDTSKIILGGASAGAISALMTVYCDKPSEMAEMGDLSALDELGGFYSSTGFYDSLFSWRVAAVVNVAGAIIDADWIEPGDVPHIAAHGDQDQTVPYSEGPYSFLSQFGFNLQGSYIIDSVARARGVCSYLYTMKGKDHPSESMGISYIKSVVNQIMLRMHAIVHGRSFCCPLSVDVYPPDTFRYQSLDTTIRLNAVILNDTGNPAIQWCGIPCHYTNQGDTQVSFPADTAMDYIATLVWEGGCEAVDYQVLSYDTTTNTGMTLFTGNTNILLYPNPAGNTLFIETGALGSQAVDIQVVDPTGRVLLQEQQAVDVQNDIRLDISTLPAGLFIIKAANNKVLAAGRFVKH